MKNSKSHDEKFATMLFATVYPLYIKKIERKGRTIDELNEVINWLTGFSSIDIQNQIERKITFATFFEEAKFNPNAFQIKGVICGYRIEEIENPLTQKVRILDKLVDDLAKGKKIEKIIIH